MDRFYTTLTADDWGLSPEVNFGILELAERGLIARVSMMSSEPYVNVGLEQLKRIPGMEFGLHLNLTHKSRFKSPQAFMKAWLFGRQIELRHWLRSELSLQLESLQKLGIEPSHFDGHQHIHIVPGVMAAIGDILKKNSIRSVRIPFDLSLWNTFRAPILPLAFVMKFSKSLKDFEVLRFRYPKSSDLRSIESFSKYLQNSKGCEVLVHPARSMDFKACGVADEMTGSRVEEYLLLKRYADQQSGDHRPVLQEYRSVSA